MSMFSCLKARDSQTIIPITRQNRAMQSWEEGSAFPPYPYSPRWHKFDVLAVLPSLPPVGWELVPSTWVKTHTWGVVGLRMYDENVACCSLADFVLRYFWRNSLYSSLCSTPRGCFPWYILDWFKACESTFNLLLNHRRVSISAFTAKSKQLSHFLKDVQISLWPRILIK